MIISVIGPSGSGKDTQSEFLEKKYNIPNISTGRLMREEIASGSEFGNKIDSFIGSGNWLPDEMTFDLLVRRLQNPDTKNGFLLNGFPRSFAQIELLDKIAQMKKDKLVAVIHFELQDEEILKRMRKQMEAGEKRTDMDEEDIRARLKNYKATIRPILKAYKKRNLLIDIDATPSIEEVQRAIKTELDKIQSQN